MKLTIHPHTNLYLMRGATPPFPHTPVCTRTDFYHEMTLVCFVLESSVGCETGIEPRTRETRVSIPPMHRHVSCGQRHVVWTATACTVPLTADRCHGNHVHTQYTINMRSYRVVKKSLWEQQAFETGSDSKFSTHSQALRTRHVIV